MKQITDLAAGTAAEHLVAADLLLKGYNAFLADQQRLLVGWPTKLALAPDFSDRVISHLERDGIRPQAQADLADLPRPPLGVPAWEQLLP